ncbi:MAG: PAS domain S-box protein, partial [Gammaproteobacteria bacterium SHHR-1]
MNPPDSRSNNSDQRGDLLRRLQKIVTHVPGMVFQYRLWPDGHSSFPYCSQGIESIYGLSPQQVHEDARAAFQVLHPQDVQRVRQGVRTSAEQLSLWHDEYRVVKDGEVRWVEGEASPERLDDGSTLWHGHIRDISARKVSEERLRESEERLQLIFNGINDGVWDWDLLRNQVYFSPRWMSQLGYQPGELEGRYETFLQLLHPADMDRVVEQINGYLEGDSRVYEVEMRLRHKDGSWRWIMARGLALRDAQGRPYRVLGSHTDIEQRKRSEARLQLAASVFADAQEGIMITDTQDRIIDINQAFCDITGYSREEALGRTPNLLNSGHHKPEFFAQMRQQLADTGHWRGEVWNRRKDGEIYAEMLNISAVHDEQGQVHHHVALFFDITVQKRHQHELERIAHYDALTGLPNRSLLADRLGQAMVNAERRNQRIVLAFIDLDGFKQVNDTHGHRIGDQLLREVAQRMRATCREGDTLAR